MHTLIIKGDKYAAYAACNAHDIDILSITRHPQFDECIISTDGHADTTAILSAWFCEHSGAPPAPAGTLMWYGPANSAPLPDNATADGHMAPVPHAPLQGDTAAVTHDDTATVMQEGV